LITRGSIEKVACGQHHTIVITYEKNLCDVYVFGDNKHGQLGFSSKTFSNVQVGSINISVLQSNIPVEIHAGWSHTNILNSN